MYESSAKQMLSKDRFLTSGFLQVDVDNEIRLNKKRFRVYLQKSDSYKRVQIHKRLLQKGEE